MAQRVKSDWILFIAIVVLVSFGLIMMYSVSSVVADLRYGQSTYFLLRQLGSASVAFLLMMFLKRQDYRQWNKPGWVFYGMGVVIALLFVVLFADPKTHRWIRLGPLQLQPSELAKPALILFLAYFVTMRATAINNRRHTLVPATILLLLLAGLVVIADLGTAVVLVATAATVFFVAGLDRRYIAVAFAGACLFIVLAVLAKPYRIIRVFGHFDPEFKLAEYFDPTGAWKERLVRMANSRDPGYHARQSKIAVGSGGIVGMGMTQGQQKLFYLPEAHTDFIYAVIGEELGLAGCTAVLLAFLVILWRGMRLACIAPDDFGRCLALGVTATIVIQAFVNMSVVLDMAPTKGIPLPMVSYGGSSLVSTLISLGMLLSVNEHAG